MHRSIPTGTAGDARSALRKPVRLRAQLRESGAGRFAIEVLDLSPTGFRAEASFVLNPGDRVWISLPGLAGLEATVAWRRGTMIGAAFFAPLHPAVFDHITALGNVS
ncbi:PilZ domain-containing protein [Sphingomonas aracearum]|nr:PilZ domain-containing protein [Sphingomonas aracearum]